MSIVRTQQWETLEKWSPRLFLLAGGAWVVMALLGFYELEYTQDPDMFIWITDPLLIAGALGVLLGLLGFYPLFDNQLPRLTQATAILVGIGILSWIWYFVGNTIEWYFISGAAFGATTTVADFPWVAVLLSIMLAFLVYGIVSLWSARPSRLVGSLMLVPFLAILLHAVAGTFIEMPDPVLLLWGVMGVVMVGLWYWLPRNRS